MFPPPLLFILLPIPRSKSLLILNRYSTVPGRTSYKLFSRNVSMQNIQTYCLFIYLIGSIFSQNSACATPNHSITIDQPQLSIGHYALPIYTYSFRGPREAQTPGLPYLETGTIVPTNTPLKDFFVSNNLTVGGDIEISGNAHYTGNVSINGTLIVGMATTLHSTLSVTGTTTLNDTLYPITSIEAGPSGTLSLGSTNDTDILNLGISNTVQEIHIGTGTAVDTINIGTGAGATTINLGSNGDSINLFGDVTYIQVEDLQVADKNITVNKDGGAASAGLAGINIEEDDNEQAGYMRTTSNRTGFEFKAPNNNAVATMLSQGLSIAGVDIGGGNTANGNMPLVEGTFSLCPRLIYGEVTDWTLPNISGTPIISAPGGWAAIQPQTPGQQTYITLTFDQPFTSKPVILINDENNLVPVIISTTTTQTTFQLRNSATNNFWNRWDTHARILVIGI